MCLHEFFDNQFAVGAFIKVDEFVVIAIHPLVWRDGVETCFLHLQHTAPNWPEGFVPISVVGRVVRGGGGPLLLG